MANFEKLVRPYQLPQTAPGRRVITSDDESEKENTVLAFNEKGSGKIESISWSFSATNYMTKQEREVKTENQ
jgi:hypothetical protein